MVKRTAQDIRRGNRFDALRRVYAAPGAVSRQDIAAATGLSFATVANLVAELIEADVLVEAGHEDSGGGRPRARLAVNAGRGVLLGVDVAETSVQAQVFDLELRVKHGVELPLPRGGSARRRRGRDRDRRRGPADGLGHPAVPGARSGRQRARSGRTGGRGLRLLAVLVLAGGPLRALLAERLAMPSTWTTR